MGEGVFATEETLPYAPPGKVVGQMKPDSCVAATCRMVIYDSSSNDIPESYLRDATKVVEDEGTFLRDAVEALAYFGVPARYESSVSLEELKAVTENGPAIVSVATPTTGGRHALIVNGFEDDYALIRDPLPEGQGSAYKVNTEVFMRAWTKGNATGQAVIIES